MYLTNQIEDIIRPHMPALIKASGLNLPTDSPLLPDVARAILVSLKIREIKPAVKIEARELGSLGEAGRRFFSEGEDVVKIPADIPRFSVRSVRFNRDSSTLKLWDSTKVKGAPKIVSGATLCHKGLALLKAGVAVLKDDAKMISITPTDLRKIYPASMSKRKDAAPTTLVGRTIKLPTSPDPVKGMFSINTKEWWPVFQALNKDAKSWSFGAAAFTLPTYPYRGIFVITDGDLIAIGGAT